MSSSMIEERLRDDLPRLAVAIVSAPPTFVAASLARRRRRRIGVACVAGLALAGAGTAVALRLVPDDVQRMNDRLENLGNCGTVLTDQAAMVASAKRADGKRLELWITPTSTGNQSTDLRIVLPDGTWSGGGGGCGYANNHEWVYTSTEVADGQTVGVIDIAGQTDTNAKFVHITFSSGAVATAAVQADGYFVVSLRDDITRYETEPHVEPLSASIDTTIPN